MVPGAVLRLLVAALVAGCTAATPGPDAADPGLVDVLERAPGLRTDIRYAGSDNFLGAPVAGYEAARCLLSPQAADALAAVHEEAGRFGLGLLVYDCYRPQRAVDHFMRWSRDASDQRAKARFYPREDKARLFERGYLARRSGHSRGSTVDLTLVDESGAPLDMGTGWDFLDPASATEAGGVPAEARRNRLLLRALMEKHGFANYVQEWWHFTLRGEPWPERYLDVPVR